MIDFAIGHFNSVTYIVLMMIGFYAMTGKTNLIEKLVGMNVFQWSVILFIVSLGAKRGATIPIVLGTHGHGESPALTTAQYVNPLPHVLMLTAIVVGVATTGVALALLLRIYKRYGDAGGGRLARENPILVNVHQSPIPVFIVVVPLITAFILPLLGWWKRRATFPVALAALSCVFASSVVAASEVLTNGPVQYFMGGVGAALGHCLSDRSPERAHARARELRDTSGRYLLEAKRLAGTPRQGGALLQRLPVVGQRVDRNRGDGGHVQSVRLPRNIVARQLRADLARGVAQRWCRRFDTSSSARWEPRSTCCLSGISTASPAR